MLRLLIHAFLISLGGNGMYLTLYSTLQGEHSLCIGWCCLQPCPATSFRLLTLLAEQQLWLSKCFQMQWKNDYFSLYLIADK